MTLCVACANQPGGCERCQGGPGEQGFSLDEKELLQLRDQVRELAHQLTDGRKLTERLIAERDALRMRLEIAERELRR